MHVAAIERVVGLGTRRQATGLATARQVEHVVVDAGLGRRTGARGIVVADRRPGHGVAQDRRVGVKHRHLVLGVGAVGVGVVTEQGEIQASQVVNCGGMWSRELAARAGVALPVHACEHFYAVTEPIADLPGNLPVLRNPDSSLYIKQDAGKLLVGAFEPVAKPWGMQGIPKNFCFDGGVRLKIPKF